MTLIEQLREPYEMYNRVMLNIMSSMETLSEIKLFSGYVDSDGNKICNGDTVTYLDYHSDNMTGIVTYGEYADGEQYIDNVHCGWYIKCNDIYEDTTTLPDAVKIGDIHIIENIRICLKPFKFYKHD
jgi:hypothetical protein